MLDECGKRGKGGSSWLRPSLCGPRRESDAGVGLLRVLYANYHSTPQHRLQSRPLESKKLVARGRDLRRVVGHCCPGELNRICSLFCPWLAKPAVHNPELESRQDPWRRFVRQLLIVNGVPEPSLQYAGGPVSSYPPSGAEPMRSPSKPESTEGHRWTA